MNLLTPEQYLEIERNAAFKSEYYQGEMFAMAGDIYARLNDQVRSRPCFVYNSDMRVRVSNTGL